MSGPPPPLKAWRSADAPSSGGPKNADLRVSVYALPTHFRDPDPRPGRHAPLPQVWRDRPDQAIQRPGRRADRLELDPGLPPRLRHGRQPRLRRGPVPLGDVLVRQLIAD